MTAFVVWVVLGVGLWALELLAPGLVAGSLGTAALLVAFATGWITSPLVQIFAFTVLGSLAILLSRRLLPKPMPELEEGAERGIAVVTTTLVPGRMGRVAYQGTTWNARCDAGARTLEPGTQVIVVGQRGNLLSVVPMEMLKD